jgi:hypothetical protein
MNVRSLANAVPGNSKIETLIGKWVEVAEQAFYAFLRIGVFQSYIFLVCTGEKSCAPSHFLTIEQNIYLSVSTQSACLSD